MKTTPKPRPHGDMLHNRRDTARVCGLTPTTLDRIRKSGDFPLPVRLGPQRIGWRQSDLDAWIASRPLAGRP